MKTLSLTAALIIGLISSSGHAHTKLVCRELDGERMTAVLTLIDKGTPLIRGELQQGVPYFYQLDLFTTDHLTPSSTILGSAVIEDVLFEFTSQDKVTAFQVYLDELDQSSMKRIGFETKSFVCY